MKLLIYTLLYFYDGDPLTDVFPNTIHGVLEANAFPGVEQVLYQVIFQVLVLVQELISFTEILFRLQPLMQCWVTPFQWQIWRASFLQLIHCLPALNKFCNSDH